MEYPKQPDGTYRVYGGILAMKSEHSTTEQEAFEWHMPKVADYTPEQWVVNELNMRIEYALRNLVKPTIKGQIKKGKIRWRGIYAHTLICESSEVYNVRLSGEGKLTDIQFAGHALKLPGVTYSFELRLFQRDHEINLNYTGKDMERYKEFRTKYKNQDNNLK